MKGEEPIVREMVGRALEGRKFVPGETPIRVAQPLFDGNDIGLFLESAREMFSKNWIGVGRYTNEFEENFSSLFDGKMALFVNSGTSADYLAVKALEERKGDWDGGNCITTALTFPSTINPVLASGLKAKLLDIRLPSYSIDTEELEEAVDEETKGIVLAHILGLPQPASEVERLARRQSMFFVEDACDALGGSYDGRLIGDFGEPSTFSFYAAHQITTGEGGMLLTSDRDVYETARSLRDWGKAYAPDSVAGQGLRKLRHLRTSRLPPDYDAHFIFERKGFNMKPIDIQAALGISQLRKLPEFTRARKKNFDALADSLKDSGADRSLMVAEPLPGSEVSWFCFPLLAERGVKRRRVVDFLEKRRIETRPILAGNIIDQPAYAEEEFIPAGSLRNTERVARDGFFVGIHPALGSEEMDYIGRMLKQALLE